MNKKKSDVFNAASEAAVETLKRNWPELTPVDRALAVREINHSGMSIRAVARRLECSESSLRHLLKASLAPAADLAAARQGEISTNELARRVRAEIKRRKKKQIETRDLERKPRAKKASKTICEWLEQEHLSGSRGEAIALEARSMLINDYAAGVLPHAEPSVVHPAAEWIEKCRPNTPVPDDANYVAWFALWLARWTFCLCRDAETAIEALAIVGKY